MSNSSERIANLSPEKLARLSQRLKEKSRDASGERIIPRRRDTNYSPLSFAQERLWFLDHLTPGNPAYNIPIAVRLSGLLKINVLEQALNEVVRRHEILRTTFSSVNGQPVQIVNPPRPFTIRYTDLSAIPVEEREERARQQSAAEAAKPFDLERSPLLRTTVLRLAPADHVLLLTLHHIVCDGWSLTILVRELAALYRAFAQARPSPLEELEIQYADYAVWQREWMQGEVLEREVEYWSKKLEGIQRVELKRGGGRAEGGMERRRRGEQQVMVMEGELVRGLRRLSERGGVTLFMTMLAGFQSLLYRYTSLDDIPVGSGIAGRNRIETEGLIGFFVNQFVLRTDLSGNPSFMELLGRVREVMLAAYAHQDLPFAKLVEELQPERSLSDNPLYQVEFVLHNIPSSTLDLPDMSLSYMEVESGTAKCDLSVEVEERSEELVGIWEYDADLLDASSVTRMSRHFQTLLGSIVADPSKPIATLPLLPPSERQHLLALSTQTTHSFPSSSSLHQMFKAQAERTPTTTALTDQHQHLSYQQLNSRANRLAHYLQGLGVGPESIVGILLSRTVEMVVSVLGVLKAGGAYLPLDEGSPEQRLGYMLGDAGAEVVITERRLMERVCGRGIKLVVVDEEGQRQEIGAHSGEEVESKAGADNLAYVIYTSGSTGKPKAVMVTHRALADYAVAIVKQLNLQVSDRFLQFASLSFDVSIEEIFPTLVSGGAIVLRDRDDLLPVANLMRVIEQEKITAMELPTSYWHELVGHLSAANKNSLDSLRFVIIAGEKVIPSKLTVWRKLGRPLVHVYGLTEATVTSTLYVVPENTQGQTETQSDLPVGRPLANTEVYILDAHMQPVPVGVTGELYIGGSCLARGYLNRPELTAEKFIPNPYGEPGTRLCKTGDLAHYLPDGNIRFIGRSDRQVSLRGFRIELGEIEAVLQQHPSVQDAVVILRDEKERLPEPIMPAGGLTGLENEEILVRRLLSLSEDAAQRLLSQLENLPENEAETALASEAIPAHQQSRRKIRRFRDFEISLELHNDQFINPPRETQKDWMLRRALDEFADDLITLDSLAERMVPGSVRPQIQGEWGTSEAHYEEGQLIIQGQQVMQDWERPLMKAMAEIVTESHGDVLEFGFGMGISATYIQEFGVRSYTVVEANDGVIEHFNKWRSQYPDRDIRLIRGVWQEVAEQLGSYDGIFFDTVPHSEEVYLRDVVNHIVMAEDIFPVAANCLRKGGIFTWYTNEIDSFSRRHQRLALKYFSSLSLSVVRDLSPPPDCHYWWSDSMIVAKAVK